MRRSGVGHLKRQTNRLDHEPHILVHLVIAESNHAVAALGKPCRPPPIIVAVLLLLVLWPVKFDDEPLSKADEVDDVRAERRLSAKLVAVDLAGAQEEPEVLFGACGLIAVSAGEVALVSVSIHGEIL